MKYALFSIDRVTLQGRSPDSDEQEPTPIVVCFVACFIVANRQGHEGMKAVGSFSDR